MAVIAGAIAKPGRLTTGAGSLAVPLMANGRTLRTNNGAVLEPVELPDKAAIRTPITGAGKEPIACIDAKIMWRGNGGVELPVELETGEITVSLTTGIVLNALLLPAVVIIVILATGTEIDAVEIAGKGKTRLVGSGVGDKPVADIAPGFMTAFPVLIVVGGETEAIAIAGTTEIVIRTTGAVEAPVALIAGEMTFVPT